MDFERGHPEIPESYADWQGKQAFLRRTYQLAETDGHLLWQILGFKVRRPAGDTWTGYPNHGRFSSLVCNTPFLITPTRRGGGPPFNFYELSDNL